MKTSPLSVLKEIAMTHVVAEPCFDCKYTDCVVVCPVEAIFYEDNLPEQWKEYTQLNAVMAPPSPVITDCAVTAQVEAMQSEFRLPTLEFQ